MMAEAIMSAFETDPPEPTDEVILAALRHVGDTARREAFAAGQPIVFLRNGRIVRQFPDGTEEHIEQPLAPPERAVKP